MGIFDRLNEENTKHREEEKQTLMMTSEKELMIEILPELKKTDGKQPWLYAVDVFETDTNRARYTCD